MKYKHIEASREARLWIRDVIVPVVAITGAFMIDPYRREFVAEKARNAKEKVKNLISRH